MSEPTINLRTYEFKLYPNTAQVTTLTNWLGICCWLYNRMLEQRIKAYRRRNEPTSYFAQCKLLTHLRSKLDHVRLVPAKFQEDALKRIDLGMQAFFRRCKTGEKPGFPRFRPRQRYNSMVCREPDSVYLRHNTHIAVPKLGLIRCRGRKLDPLARQKSLRIIRRATGWYAQILVELPPAIEVSEPPGQAIGVDMGLQYFATMSDGEVIDNPRFSQAARQKLTALQRRVSRRKKGSKNRGKAVLSLRKQHELVANQRRAFCHQHSTSLIRHHALIAVEKLNVKGMVRSIFGKSILDAAWGTFINQLRVKAACAGRQLIEVDPRYTSQECPDCGQIKPKSLSERMHLCECGCDCQRDHASAQVILARALGLAGATRPSTDPASVSPQCAAKQVGRKKREALTGH